MDLPTLLVLLAVIAVLAAICISGIRARKKGGGCGCGCANCPSAGLCHPQQH